MRDIKNNKPILLTGFEEINFGKQYRTNKLMFLGAINSNKWLENGKDYSRNFHQGYRVYSSSGISNTISASSIGGFGGNSGLYLVVNERTNNS